MTCTEPAVNIHILLTSVRISSVINTIELYFQFNKKNLCKKKEKRDELHDSVVSLELS